MVFDMESLSLARAGRPFRITEQGHGGSPNKGKGRRVRHPFAENGEEGLIKPLGSAGGKAH